MIGASPYVQSSSSGDIDVSVFKNEKTGQFAIVALNESFKTPSTPIVFKLQNFNPTTVTPWLTLGDKDVNLQKKADIPVVDGSFSFTLPNVSIVTFVGQYGLGTSKIAPNPNSQKMSIQAFHQKNGIALHMNNPASANVRLEAINGQVISEWKVLGRADQILPLDKRIQGKVAILRVENSSTNLKLSIPFIKN